MPRGPRFPENLPTSALVPNPEPEPSPKRVPISIPLVVSVASVVKFVKS